LLHPAIHVDHVFKKFRRGERHDSLRDALGHWFRRGAAADRRRELQRQEFWALHDAHFDVHSGEALGVIGPNGAGKSTLLKLLAGIMRPTRGQIALQGRVSALIEVGAGFHPDLTGRENIYLNASILGMSRRETRRKFDEIVDFAGVRDFLDTPIKRYSSGMYARLGYAVAAHADPDVLLVDEVLSVGDRSFRAKCMDQMRAFVADGVAVVFVSHDLGAVSAFCDRALVMASGRTSFTGSATHAVAHYHGACIEPHLTEDALRGAVVDVRAPVRLNEAGLPAHVFSPGDEAIVEYGVRFDIEMKAPSFGLSVMRAEDRLIVFETSSTRINNASTHAAHGAVQRVRYRLRLNLPPGEYCVGHHVRERDESRYVALREDAGRFLIRGRPISGGLVDLDPRVDVFTDSPARHPEALSA